MREHLYKRGWARCSTPRTTLDLTTSCVTRNASCPLRGEAPVKCIPSAATCSSSGAYACACDLARSPAPMRACHSARSFGVGSDLRPKKSIPTCVSEARKWERDDCGPSIATIHGNKLGKLVGFHATCNRATAARSKARTRPRRRDNRKTSARACAATLGSQRSTYSARKLPVLDRSDSSPQARGLRNSRKYCCKTWLVGTQAHRSVSAARRAHEQR